MKKLTAVLILLFFIIPAAFAAQQITLTIAETPTGIVTVTVPGPAGVDGKPGPAQYIPKGVWSPFANYSTNHQVNYGGSSFVAVAPNANVTPSEGAIWTLIAAKGDQGPAGPLNIASASTLGGIKVGSGLAITVDGTLNNTGIAGVASFAGRGGAVTPATGDYSIGQISGAATVAATGSYTDLINKPAIPAAQVNADWNAASGVAQILNKPTVPTALSQLAQDATHRTVTDAEKATWNTVSASVNSVNSKTGTVTLTATDVGADPLGSATSVQTNLTAHTARTDNPHVVTKAQIGLGSVDNTSDAAKPVSTATQAALNLKATASSILDPFYFVAKSNQGPTSHQGAAFDGTYYYFIDTNALYKRAVIDGPNLATNADPNGDIMRYNGAPGLNHLGAGSVFNGNLYVAAEHWVSCSDFAHPYIAVFRTSDLAFVTAYPAAPGYEISAVDVVPEDGAIYATSYCSNSIQKYSRTEPFPYLNSIEFSIPVGVAQGVTHIGNQLYVSSDASPKNVYQVEKNGNVVGSVYSPTVIYTDGPGNAEGIFAYKGDLYWWDGVPNGSGMRYYQLSPHPVTLAHHATHATGGSDPITPADIGLGSVDNTSDAAKPISTATQSALDLKANANALPSNTSAVSHYFLTGYNTSTKAFSMAQPTFSDLLSPPTTLAGYGITDAYTKAFIDSALTGKLSDAPSDGNSYARRNGAWSLFVGGVQPFANISTALRTNGIFTPSVNSVAQDGTHGIWMKNTVPYTGARTGGAIFHNMTTMNYCETDNNCKRFGSGNSSGGITQTDLNTALAAKANLASPAFTGTPTAPTASGGTSSAQIATTAFVASAIASLGSGTIGGTVGTTTDRIPVASGTGGNTLKASTVSIDPTTSRINVPAQTNVVDAVTLEDGAGKGAGFVLMGALSGNYHLGIPTDVPTAGQVLVTGTPVTAQPVHGITTTIVPLVPTTNTIISGTYTPTITGASNFNSATPYKAHWLRVNNEVTVSGRMIVSSTSSNTTTAVLLSLPPEATSTFADSQDLAGAATGYPNPHSGLVYGDTGTNKARITWYDNAIGSLDWAYTFTYTVK